MYNTVYKQAVSMSRDNYDYPQKGHSGYADKSLYISAILFNSEQIETDRS